MIPEQGGPVEDQPGDARTDRDEAIDMVERGADAAEFEAALDAVFVVAAARPEFTTDEVVELLTSSGWAPREPRVLGAVMRKAAGFGWVRPSQRYAGSARRRSHARPKRVWLSQLYLEPEAALTPCESPVPTA